MTWLRGSTFMDREPKEDPKLTALIATELRELPDVRAPASLQARVFAELARRQSLPWWRQSFRHWPMAAQAVFALLAIGLMHPALWSPAFSALQELIDPVTGGALDILHWAQALAAGITILGTAFGDVFAALPSRWLFAMAMAMALGSSCVLLLVSGTLVYRALHTRP